jgi:hypothetical protein
MVRELIGNALNLLKYTTCCYGNRRCYKLYRSESSERLITLESIRSDDPIIRELFTKESSRWRFWPSEIAVVCEVEQKR